MSLTWIILFSVLFLGLGVLFLGRFLRNVQPTDDEILDDLKELKASVTSFKGGFIPWTEEFSPKQLDQVLTKSNARSGNGVFLSKEDDPIFAYAFRQYIGPGRNALLYILSLDHEYVFRITNIGTSVTRDGQKIGLIRDNGVFYDTKNDEVARIQALPAQSINKIFIGQEEVAKIALPDAIAHKGLEVTKLDLSPLEQKTIQTLAVYDLVHHLSNASS